MSEKIHTIIITCSTPLASASSPHFFQYEAEALSSPSIIVEPWENRWTGVILGGGGGDEWPFGRLLSEWLRRAILVVLVKGVVVRVCFLLFKIFQGGRSVYGLGRLPLDIWLCHQWTDECMNKDGESMVIGFLLRVKLSSGIDVRCIKGCAGEEGGMQIARFDSARGILLHA